MKIKAIAPWFGGKRNMARAIVEQLGPHKIYFEPMCGGLGVLFAKEPCSFENVNDLHGDLTNLARVVQGSAAPILYERLIATLFCEGLLADSRHFLADNPNPGHNLVTEVSIERAYHFFLCSWMARNGVAGTERDNYQIAVRWTKNGGSATTRWRSAVDSIPAWHERLRSVVILNRDAFDIIPLFSDEADTAIYVDPPYTAETRCFQAEGNKMKYRHEFTHRPVVVPLYGDCPADMDDHDRLRDMLAAFKKARIVVSYYDCKRVRDLYRGWTFIDCKTTKTLAQQNKRSGAGPSVAPEVLIVNGPVF